MLNKIFQVLKTLDDVREYDITLRERVQGIVSTFWSLMILANTAEKY